MSYPRGHVKGLVHGVVKSVPHVVGKKSVDLIAASIISKVGAYWDLTEAAGTSRLDSTGGTANMTQYTSTGTAGNIGTNTGPRGGADVAVAFTGDGSKLATPDQLKLRAATSHCLFGWFFLPANTAPQYMAFKWDTIDFVSMEYVVSVSAGPIIQGYNAGSAGYTLANRPAPAINNWHFVCMWRDSADGLLRLNLDGSTIGVSAAAGNISASAHAFSFGAGGTGGIPGNPNASPMTGRLSRWGYCKGSFLTSAEITWMMNSGNGRNWAEILAVGA